MKKAEETNENPITPTSILSRGVSDGSAREQMALLNEEIKTVARQQADEQTRETFAEQQEAFLSEQAARFKNQNQNFSYKGKESGYWTSKVHNVIDHIPFGFRAKISYQYPKDVSLTVSTDLIDANVKLPLRSNEQTIQPPQQILVKMDVPEQIQLIPAVGSLNPRQLPPSFLGSVGIASLLLSALLLVSPTTRERIILAAVGLPLFAIKQGAGLSLSTLKKVYNLIRKRHLNPEFKKFFLEESKNEGKKEVDILIIQALISLLPNEKKRGSVVIFNLPNNIIPIGSYGKISRVWRRNQFKVWKEKKERQLFCEIVFNLDIPPSSQFEPVEHGPTWFFVPPFMVRKNQYNFKAIDKLMQKGML